MIFHFAIWFLLCIYAIALRKQGKDFRRRWKQGKTAFSESAQTSFSIVVAFRNEEQNLAALIQSIKQLNYPANLIEVVLVDDHSSDQGAAMIEKHMAGVPFTWKLLRNKQHAAGKKMALKKGIENATHIYIVATDADCEVPQNWLRGFEQLIQSKDAVFVGGPVLYTAADSGVLSTYQVIENAGLIVFGANGISGGYPFMANGANIGYAKSVFEEQPVFEEQTKTPGGDDEAVLLKISEKYPDKLGFLFNPECLVKTPVQLSWSDLLEQRIRWASKARILRRSNVFATQVFIAVFFACMWFEITLALASNFGLFALITLGIKILADLYFYRYFRTFFGLQIAWPKVALASIVQTVFVPIVAIGSLAGGFRWKGRVYRA